MKKISLWIITLLLTFWIGFSTTGVFTVYLQYLELQNSQMPVNWQDDESSCNDFTNKNPLCDYSFDLHEVPTVSLAELMANPQLYDGKIIRVRGRFFNDHQYPFSSRLSRINGSDTGKLFISAGYWNSKIAVKLCSYIDLNAPQTNAADVTLIIQFLDASRYPLARNKFLMTILHVENIKPVLPVSVEHLNQERQFE